MRKNQGMRNKSRDFNGDGSRVLFCYVSYPLAFQQQNI